MVGRGGRGTLSSQELKNFPNLAKLKSKLNNSKNHVATTARLTAPLAKVSCFRCTGKKENIHLDIMYTMYDV